MRDSFHALVKEDPDRFRLVDAGRAPELVAADVRDQLDQWVAALV